MLWLVFLNKFKNDRNSVKCDQANDDSDSDLDLAECIVKFGSDKETPTIKYRFKANKYTYYTYTYTMIPHQIQVFDADDNLYTQFNYLNFSANFLTPLVSPNLPIGKYFEFLRLKLSN